MIHYFAIIHYLHDGKSFWERNDLIFDHNEDAVEFIRYYDYDYNYAVSHVDNGGWLRVQLFDATTFVLLIDLQFHNFTE